MVFGCGEWVCMAGQDEWVTLFQLVLFSLFYDLIDNDYHPNLCKLTLIPINSFIAISSVHR